MKPHVLLTGATGFLGRHVAEALRDQGYAVRALCRSDDKDLRSLGVEIVRGDVTSKDDVARAVDGIDAVVHAAGFVSRDERDRGRMMQVHVHGTRLLAEACLAAKVTRFVHVSTSGTKCVGTDPKMVYREDDPVAFDTICGWGYYLSKHFADRALEDALRLAPAEQRERMALITLRPTLVLGPGDDRRSSTADVERFLKRELPITPEGGLSFVDVRDVAAATVTALEEAKPGSEYLLSAINLTFGQFFERLSEISGVKGPLVPIKVPRRFAKLGVSVLGQVAKAVGAEPALSTTEADMAGHYWYVDARKATAELGFAPRDPMATLRDTVRDLRGQSARARAV